VDLIVLKWPSKTTKLSWTEAGDDVEHITTSLMWIFVVAEHSRSELQLAILNKILLRKKS